MLLDPATRAAALASRSITIKVTDSVGGFIVAGATRHDIVTGNKELTVVVVPEENTQQLGELLGDWIRDHLWNPEPIDLAEITAAWRRQHDM